MEPDLSAILPHLPSFILEVDANAVIRYINRDGPHHARDKIIGTRAGTHLGDQRELFERAFERARETRQAQSYEAPSYGRTYAVWVVPSFDAERFEGATLVATDVTEARRLVTALRASEQKTRAVIGALPDLVFLLNRDSVYLDVKAEQERDLAAPADALVGNRLDDILPPAVAAGCRAAIHRALDTREMQVFEYQLELPHGVQDFEARFVASGAEEVVCVARNMTDRKRIERQLSAADRLVSLGTLVAGVAHEMNNPLSYVLLNLHSAQKMLAATGGLPEVGERIAKAEEGARTMQQIMQSLTTFSHGRNVAVTAVDVPGVLDWAIGMVEGSLDARTNIVRDYAGAPPIAGNRETVGQVFLNLLLNAAQALREPADEGHHVAISARGERQQVIIEIVDNGVGISPEDRPRIFEPFFTTKPAGVGTGLGLWICHNIVTGMGGSIEVDSMPNRGTTVRVALPRAAA